MTRRSSHPDARQRAVPGRVTGPHATRSGTAAPAPSPARPDFPSAPEITTDFAPAGRETFAAIASELLAPGGDEGPDVEFGHELAGRETLAAIAAELLPDLRPPHEAAEGQAAPLEASRRVRTHTVDYADRPARGSPTAAGSGRAALSRARASPLPAVAASGRRATASREPPPADATSTHPEPQPCHELPPEGAAAGRATLAALDGHLRAWAQTGTPPQAPVLPEPERLEIHEMVTFVVRGDLGRLTSERARREFVREHLAHRLPVSAPDDVARIDVTPWTVKGTVIVRVWCRVDPPTA